MTITEVQICNLALYKVGAERITSLSDETKAGRLCNDIYAFCRDFTLVAHPWNFATERVALGLTATVPAFGFDAAFQLPSNCLRVVETEYDDYETFTYKVESDLLLCNESSIKIEYIKQITDTSKFSPAFVEAFTYYLASNMAYPLVQSNELMVNMNELFRRTISAARLYDAQEGSGRQLRKSAWTDVRL